MIKKHKLIAVFLVLSALSLFTPTSALAAIVTIRPQGDVVWQVLGDETSSIQKPAKIDIKNVQNTNLSLSDAQVSLTKNSDSIVLDVKSPDGEHQADVTNIQDNLIEIEARPQTQKISIGYLNSNFLIQENGIIAKTQFPISVNAKTNQITVTTPSGNRILGILPSIAVINAMNSKNISVAPTEDEIIENSNGELSYLLSAKKNLNIFNLFKYSYENKVYISALSGEVTKVETANWYNKILGFLFS